MSTGCRTNKTEYTISNLLRLYKYKQIEIQQFNDVRVKYLSEYSSFLLWSSLLLPLLIETTLSSLSLPPCLWSTNLFVS